MADISKINGNNLVDANAIAGVQVAGDDLTVTSRKVNVPLASTSTPGVIKAASSYATEVNSSNKCLYTTSKTYSAYTSAGDTMFVGKGTLENVLSNRFGGTNDGSNWTSLTINGTTKNIPTGGSGGGAIYIHSGYIRFPGSSHGTLSLNYRFLSSSDTPITSIDQLVDQPFLLIDWTTYPKYINYLGYGDWWEVEYIDTSGTTPVFGYDDTEGQGSPELIGSDQVRQL